MTGGAGFIGSRLVSALLERGLAVTVLDDLSVGRKENVPAAARLIQGSILDRAAVREALSGCDAVFHLAARVAIRSSFEFVVDDTTTNVAGAATVLREAQTCGSIRRLVTASSMAVYQDSPEFRPAAESHPAMPISPYGASKLCAEHLTHQMCAQAGIASVVLRLFNTYGPGQRLSPYVGVITIFVNKLMAGEPAVIFGDGEQCRDFVHRDDVVQGFLLALESQVTGETFNIGTGVATSVNQVLAELQRVLGVSGPPQHAPALDGELRYAVADISKARRVLGYRPAFRFEDAIGPVAQEIAAGVRAPALRV